MGQASHNYTTHPICPYCGNIERDAWEINFGDGMEGEAETDCGDCGKTYRVIREVEVSYSTSKMEGI